MGCGCGISKATKTDFKNLRVDKGYYTIDVCEDYCIKFKTNSTYYLEKENEIVYVFSGEEEMRKWIKDYCGTDI